MTQHMCLDIRGFLMHGRKSEFKRLLRDTTTGKYLSAEEARNTLLDELAAGRKVLPIGTPCEGFSYETGCPGHE